MTKTFTNMDSKAIHTIEVEDNSVYVVYNSNVDKKYTFNCENVDEFVDNLSSQLVDLELANGLGSVGKFLHQQIKSGALVESK